MGAWPDWPLLDLPVLELLKSPGCRHKLIANLLRGNYAYAESQIFLKISALYKSFTYLLTYYAMSGRQHCCIVSIHVAFDTG